MIFPIVKLYEVFINLIRPSLDFFSLVNTGHIPPSLGFFVDVLIPISGPERDMMTETVVAPLQGFEFPRFTKGSETLPFKCSPRLIRFRYVAEFGILRQKRE
jgi:hypothetical protein